MPDRPELVVDDDTGTERFRLTGESARKRESLIEQWTGRIVVDRAAWLDVETQLDEVNDRVRIERGDGTTFFAGRFRDDNRDGNDVTVIIDSYEQDAIDAEPTGGRVSYSNVADETVAVDAINSVPTLQPGTTETGAASVSFSFANAEQAKVIRDAAEPAGMDVAYNNDRTVDFLNRLGSDKTGSITVSSTTQEIVNALSVEKNSSDPVTHVRGLGAQQGPDQVTAEAIIPSYSSGDRQVWREYKNKDVKNEDRLQTIVDRLADEYENNRRRILIEAGLTDVDVAIGDSITVDLPEHDINQGLRIVNLTEFINAQVQRFKATLTNRSAERGGERKRRDDLNRFNAGDQGFIDRDNDSYGWQPVTSSVNATRPYFYPSDVLNEIVAEVYVSSIPYRAYSQGAASGGGAFVTSESGESHTHDVNIGATSDDNTTYAVVEERQDSGSLLQATADSWELLDTFSPSNVTSEAMLYGMLAFDPSSGSGGTPTEYQTRVYDQARGEYIPDTDGVSNVVFGGSDDVSNVITIKIPGDHDINNLEWQVQFNDDVVYAYDANWNAIEPHRHFFSTTETSEAESTHTHDVDVPNHTHDPQPGLIEFPTETASGVDLIVNGNTVATDIGSGEFDTTVDISGELTAGNNTIEATSDSLGLINMTVRTQLFRRGRTSP